MIEFVTHCWNPPELPIYAKLLNAQLSSIARWGTGDVKTRVYYTPGDYETADVVEWWAECGDVIPEPMAPGALFRRAVGRDDAAGKTEARVVWMTDCDYWFGPECFKWLREYAKREKREPLVFPKHVQISRTHEDGDRTTERLPAVPGLARLTDDTYKQMRVFKAIGGVMILDGDWLREHGYLRGTRWTEPVDPEAGFQRCRCDVQFRRKSGLGKGTEVKVPGVRRIRHTMAGREFARKRRKRNN